MRGFNWWRKTRRRTWKRHTSTWSLRGSTGSIDDNYNRVRAAIDDIVYNLIYFALWVGVLDFFFLPTAVSWGWHPFMCKWLISPKIYLFFFFFFSFRIICLCSNSGVFLYFTICHHFLSLFRNAVIFWWGYVVNCALWNSRAYLLLPSQPFWCCTDIYKPYSPIFRIYMILNLVQEIYIFIIMIISKVICPVCK